MNNRVGFILEGLGKKKPLYVGVIKFLTDAINSTKPILGVRPLSKKYTGRFEVSLDVNRHNIRIVEKNKDTFIIVLDLLKNPIDFRINRGRVGIGHIPDESECRIGLKDAKSYDHYYMILIIVDNKNGDMYMPNYYSIHSRMIPFGNIYRFRGSKSYYPEIEKNLSYSLCLRTD